MGTAEHRSKKRRLLLLVPGGILLAVCASGWGQVVVIANTSVKATQVTRSDLRDAFTGVSGALSDGSRVSPVLLKDGTVHDLFLSLYVGKSDAAFRANWRSLLFSGQGLMPHTLSSESEVMEYVARTPGTIGYVLKTTPHEGVKTLAVK